MRFRNIFRLGSVVTNPRQTCATRDFACYFGINFSAHLLHDDPLAPDLIQIELHRGDRLGFLLVRRVDKAEKLALRGAAAPRATCASSGASFAGLSLEVRRRGGMAAR